MPSLPRALALLAGVAVLAATGWASMRSFATTFASAQDQDGASTGGWLTGPSVDALFGAADTRTRRGARALSNTSLPPERRLGEYTAELRVAERLLVRGLRLQPHRTLGLARLIAVRWDLAPAFDDAQLAGYLAAIGRAARLAPRVPSVQLQMGELLLRMGRVDEATPYLRRTLALDPGRARRVVELLDAQAVPPEVLLDLLPRTPEVLLALRSPFHTSGDPAKYADALERALPHGPAPLLEAFGDACLAARQPRRLRQALEALGFSSDAPREGERLLQIARALLEEADPAAAAAWAGRARALRPEDPHLLERAGQIALAADDPVAALDAFRACLVRIAHSSEQPAWRARLYDRIGQAEERRGRTDLAYDAYRRAADLNPLHDHAAGRLRQIEQAAGKPPGGS